MNNQTVYVKRKSSNYVIIDNKIFQDNRISYKAKGILAYLISKPNDWKILINDLYGQSTDGYTSIRSGLKELVLAGYMELRTKFDPDGEVFKGRRYYVYEAPLFTEGWRNPTNSNKNYTTNEGLVYQNPLKTN